MRQESTAVLAMRKVSVEQLIEYTLESALPPPQRRKVVLEIAGVSPTAVAREASVSRQATTRVIAGTSRSAALEEAIVRAINEALPRAEVSQEAFFPEHYPID